MAYDEEHHLILVSIYRLTHRPAGTNQSNVIPVSSQIELCHQALKLSVAFAGVSNSSMVEEAT